VRLQLAADSDPRVETWDAERKAVLFGEAFERSLRFVWERSTRRRSRQAVRPALKLAAG